MRFDLACRGRAAEISSRMGTVMLTECLQRTPQLSIEHLRVLADITSLAIWSEEQATT